MSLKKSRIVPVVAGLLLVCCMCAGAKDAGSVGPQSARTTLKQRVKVRERGGGAGGLQLLQAADPATLIKLLVMKGLSFLVSICRTLEELFTHNAFLYILVIII